MFKVMGWGTWPPAMFKVMEGARSVSHVGIQGDWSGRGASAMYKVMGGRGGEEPQPCTR